MDSTLENLLQQKKLLTQRIYIAQTGNDSYFLSPLYQKHQAQLRALTQQIEKIQQTQPFSTDDSF